MPADIGLSRERRIRGWADVVRALGTALTIVGGPLAGLAAWRLLRMSAAEAIAVMFLVSVWLGPKLMRLRDPYSVIRKN